MEEERDYSLVKYRIIKYSVIVIVLALLIGIGVYLYMHRNRNYSSWKTLNATEFSMETTGNYMQFADGFIRYTTDGISYISGGAEIWNKSLSVHKPVIDICEDYIVIGEQNTNNLSVINKSGAQLDITMTYPIISVEVSAQGIVAANLDDGEANYIEVRDKEGEQIAIGRTVIQGDGYPVDISLSNDGTKVMASYLSVDHGTTQSNVVFYNYSAVGQNEVDRIVGGFNQYKTSLVPKVEFIENNIAAAFGTDMFTIYNIKQKPSIMKEEKLDKKVESVFYGNGNTGLVLENIAGEHPYLVKTYNDKGKEILNYETDYPYKGIMFAGDYVMMYNDTSCKLLSEDGVVRFETNFDMVIEEMFALSEERYIIVSSTAAYEIQLVQ